MLDLEHGRLLGIRDLTELGTMSTKSLERLLQKRTKLLEKPLTNLNCGQPAKHFKAVDGDRCIGNKSERNPVVHDSDANASDREDVEKRNVTSDGRESNEKDGLKVVAYQI